MDTASGPQSSSRSRLPPRSPVSRPTTPLRPSSRTSLRNSQNNALHASTAGDFPLDILEPQFAELSDSMADLEANFMHLQLMHESLSRFGESFASFLYGLNMRAFCVDFPEAPTADAIKRFHKQQQQREKQEMSAVSSQDQRTGLDSETTFMTTDTSFVDSTSMRATPKRAGAGVSASSRPAGASTRGPVSSRGSLGRGTARGGRGSGLARPRGRGIR